MTNEYIKKSCRNNGLTHTQIKEVLKEIENCNCENCDISVSTAIQKYVDINEHYVKQNLCTTPTYTISGGEPIVNTEKKYVQELPPEQLKIVNKAIDSYRKIIEEDNNESYDHFDLGQLKQFFTYPTKIFMSEEQKDNFSKCGQDYPMYTDSYGIQCIEEKISEEKNSEEKNTIEMLLKKLYEVCPDEEIFITEKFEDLIEKYPFEKKYRYSVSTSNIWFGLDNGIVWAKNYEEARKKSEEKLTEDLEKINNALKGIDEIEVNISEMNIEVEK